MQSSSDSVPKITFQKQRNVSKELGKNITQHHQKIYDEIEKRIGKTKKCTFGHKRGSKTGIKHEGPQDVLVRQFELKGVKVIDGVVIIEKGDGLQGQCKECGRRRRRERIRMEKEEKDGMTSSEVYELYQKKYGLDIKKCSRCKIEKTIYDFNISKTMECGLHNVCNQCSKEYGSSVSNRWIIYMPDGNYKYKKSIDDQKNQQHDDHIFPLCLGGSNEEINHQLISSKENLSKSNDINHFLTIDNINPNLLSQRFRYLLKEANDLQHLKIILTKAINDDIMNRNNMNDEQLVEVYRNYCKTNNMRKNIHRAVIKFREYCKLRFDT